MPQGTIKKVVSDRGFGFIAGESGDVFFHHSAVQDMVFEDIQVGQAVEYTVDEDARSDKGPRAGSVRPVLQ